MEKKSGEGKIWVCPACGKTADYKLDLRDTSCIINAVLCHDEKRPHPETEEMIWHAVEQPEES